MRRFAILSTLVISLLISANAWGIAPPTYNITDLGSGAATAINSSRPSGGLRQRPGLPQGWSQWHHDAPGHARRQLQCSLRAQRQRPGGRRGGCHRRRLSCFSLQRNHKRSRLHFAVTEQAYGVNIAGQVVGVSNYQAFLYNGTMHRLGFLGGNDSVARGINASGTIVGWSIPLAVPSTPLLPAAAR